MHECSFFSEVVKQGETEEEAYLYGVKCRFASELNPGFLFFDESSQWLGESANLS